MTTGEVTTHDHEFDDPPKKGLVRMCVDRSCTAIRVGTGKKWREPTASELMMIVCRMMEDIVIAQAMTIVHGQERGMKRAREVLGYAESVSARSARNE